MSIPTLTKYRRALHVSPLFGGGVNIHAPHTRVVAADVKSKNRQGRQITTRQKKRPRLDPVNGLDGDGGGAGGIWTPVRKPCSGRSTCLAVCFRSRHLCRAVARYTGRQHPIFSPRVKVPSPEPADEIIFTAGSV